MGAHTHREFYLYYSVFSTDFQPWCCRRLVHTTPEHDLAGWGEHYMIFSTFVSPADICCIGARCINLNLSNII